MASVEACAGCGLELPGGTFACYARFEELLALEFGDARFFRVHRLTVDTYAVQHPERHCVSPTSFTAHLTGLCATMEHEDPVAVNARVQRWLSTKPDLEKPSLPVARGRRTIADVTNTDDPAVYVDQVRRWGRSAWEAFADLHPIAREWIRRSMDQRR